MKTGALHCKSMPEILDRIKDRPADMKRALVETVQQMLADGFKPKPSLSKKRLTSDDAFGSWVGLVATIKGARTENPQR